MQLLFPIVCINCEWKINALFRSSWLRKEQDLNFTKVCSDQSNINPKQAKKILKLHFTQRKIYFNARKSDLIFNSSNIFFKAKSVRKEGKRTEKNHIKNQFTKDVGQYINKKNLKFFDYSTRFDKCFMELNLPTFFA